MLTKAKSFLPEKWKIFSTLSLSFAISFMITVYSPLDIYLHNPTAFVVGWRFLLPPLLILFVICFVAISVALFLFSHKNIIFGLAVFIVLAVLVILARFVFNIHMATSVYVLPTIVGTAILWAVLNRLLKDKAADVILLVLWGVLISAYVQVLFLNGNMESIAGTQPDHKSLIIPNLLIWIAIILVPVCVYIVLMIKKREFKFEKILVITALIISGMQIVGLVSTAATSDLPKGYDEDNSGYVSYKPMLSLSSEENIIIFMVDMLSVKNMREGIERYPHIRETLDGFTHYENSIAEFFRTLPAATTMLTQHYYRDGQNISEYWTEAWAQQSYLDTLRENGYTTNLYLDFMTTYGSLEEIEGKTDNIREFDAIRVSARSFTTSVMRLSLGRISPYLIKNTLLAPVSTAFGNDLYTLVVSDPLAVQPPIVGHESDVQFLEYIKLNELSADNSKKVFTLIHLMGAHFAYGGGVHHLEQNFAAIEIYFEKMKEIGVYDNSTIIIIGDHGDNYAEYPDTFFPTSTSVLIKPRGSTGELIINNEAELSHKYFPASILEAAGFSHSELGLSFFDIIEGASPPPTRTIYAHSDWWGSFEEFGTSGMTMSLVGLFEVTGNSNYEENWVFVENTR